MKTKLWGSNSDRRLYSFYICLSFVASNALDIGLKGEFMDINRSKDRSDISTYADVIKMHIQDEDPVICIINESNVKPEDDIDTIFPNCHIENKFEDNHPKARTTVLIKKNSVQYERLKHLEEANFCTVWIRVKFSGSKWLYIAGTYRQWRLPAETGLLATCSTREQLASLIKILAQI